MLSLFFFEILREWLINKGVLTWQLGKIILYLSATAEAPLVLPIFPQEVKKWEMCSHMSSRDKVPSIPMWITIYQG